MLHPVTGDKVSDNFDHACSINTSLCEWLFYSQLELLDIIRPLVLLKPVGLWVQLLGLMTVRVRMCDGSAALMTYCTRQPCFSLCAWSAFTR